MTQKDERLSLVFLDFTVSSLLCYIAKCRKIRIWKTKDGTFQSIVFKAKQGLRENVGLNI